MSETKQKNLPVKRYGAITNGTICNDNLIRILREYPFRVLQITLDGPPEVHNQRRVDTEGQGTWEVIVANVKNILEETEIRIVIHTVIDSQNWKYYGELLELLLTRLGSWIYSPDNRLIFNLGMESHPGSS
ncbi:MAG: hypothetical protein DDT23_01112 [candidate division WS2 bacterium]|nr:hypothetical protein [Candidatus Lithacetigena glycinireducens]